MIQTTTKVALLAGSLLFATQTSAQIGKVKLEKPKLNVSTPSGTKQVSIPHKDESGLFAKCTDDPSAEVHRKNAVANLETLEGYYNSSSINYSDLEKLLVSNERSLESIQKLEPKVDRTKYDERYLPLKERADKELVTFTKLQELEAMFQKDFNARTEMKNPNPITFRKTEGYSSHQQCYCRNYKNETKTLAEFETAKKEYEAAAAQLMGYKNEKTQTLFTNMETCISNGNQYAIWASTDELKKQVVDYDAANKAAKPKKVILRCEEYLVGLTNIESDNSLRLDAKATEALKAGKEKVAAIKAEAERYISSGEFQAYEDQIHAEEIAKVKMPKAEMKNATLEAGAMKYVKGEEYNDYLKNRTGDSEVATPLRAVCTTASPYVDKNEYGIPNYKYHEIWVAYKGKDGKCYLAAVYASYTYMGGGTYATTPTWGADAPDEMACENVNK